MCETRENNMQTKNMQTFDIRDSLHMHIAYRENDWYDIAYAYITPKSLTISQFDIDIAYMHPTVAASCNYVLWPQSREVAGVATIRQRCIWVGGYCAQQKCNFSIQ